jgi:hypothetical protein
MDIFTENEDGLSILLDNISKSSLNKISMSIVKNVEDGNTDALQEYIKAKGLSELASMLVESLKDEAIDEALKYGNDHRILGCKILVKGSPTSYDYSHDEEWTLYDNQINNLKLLQKDREKQMLDAMKYSELIDADGEVIPPANVKKQGGQTLSITIPS